MVKSILKIGSYADNCRISKEDFLLREFLFVKSLQIKQRSRRSARLYFEMGIGQFGSHSAS